MVRMSAVLERIDRRNLKMETEPVEGGFMLKFIPKTHSQQTIEGQKEADRQYEQIMKYSALKLWPSKYLNENREKIQKISEYDNAPEKVIADLRLLMADTESLTYKIPESGVISRPAASTSCRSFFITSA